MDCKQVEELLPGYALNALGPEEAASVEAHLETCRWCPPILREHIGVAAHLAHGAEPVQLPEHLKHRTLRAAARHRPRQVQQMRPLITTGRILIGATASIAVLLLAGAIAIDLRMSSQIDDLQQENAQLVSQVSQLAGMSDQIGNLRDDNIQLASQVTQLAKDDEKLVDMLLEQRSMSYIMALPDKDMMPLQGGEGDSKARGMLIVSSHGSTGVLMANGLEPSSEDNAYRVWLRRNGQRLTVGQLWVDNRGWGTLTLWPDLPITFYQQVWITAEPSPDAGSVPVLWGSIVSR